MKQIRLGQFRLEGQGPNELKVHALREDGNSSCGNWVDAWRKQKVVMVVWKGPASEVTCGSCHV